MPLAEAPQQAANLPDIVSRATMRAATYVASPLYGKFDDIVGLRLHGPNNVIEPPGIDCDRTLTDAHARGICTKTETCVD